MKRPVLSVGLAAFFFLVPSISLFDLGCANPAAGCDWRRHPGHLDEYGQPDPCCFSAVPCCTNPLWGRKAVKNGYEVEDECCIEVPCPFWDVNKGADAGTDSATPEPEK